MYTVKGFNVSSIMCEQRENNEWYNINNPKSVKLHNLIRNIGIIVLIVSISNIKIIL